MNRRKLLKILERVVTILLVFSFFLSPVLPVMEVSARAVSDLEVTLGQNPISHDEVINNEKIPETILYGEKFKKDSSRSMDDELSLVRKHIITNNLPKEALERLDQFEIEQSELKKGKVLEGTALDSNNALIEAKRQIKQKSFIVESFEGKVEKHHVKDYEKDFPNNKSKRNIFEKVRDFVTMIFIPKKVLAVDDDPAHFLGEGNEIKFSQAIKDEVNLLGHDPLKILNFVRNNVEYVPYFGGKKGSDATLVEHAGNDMDKSSLLIAMLRYSNIPARYHRAQIKVDIGTITDLLGVETADAAGELLTLNDISTTLYTLENGEPAFFVIDYTYVEAYIPYGYSRGADLTDGGVLQWVPMDPTMNAYYHEQLVDVAEHLNTHGFAIETFYENYLNNAYGTQEPLDAFKSVVTNTLASNPPTYYPNLSYADALSKKYPKIQNLEFIPGTLLFAIASDIDSYNFLPNNLRHTIKFIIKDKTNVEVLNYTAFMSDIADKELLVTYDPATANDQTIINSFATIYDVVPLSLVNVKPVIKANGIVLSTGSSATTLGEKQMYTMEWSAPNGNGAGDPIISTIYETYEKATFSGSSEAIALNTDRVIPPELRPTQDTQTTSYVNDQLLYSTALDYLNRLQYSHDELARIIGGGFVHVATKASVFNGIEVTNSGGVPYSFSWKGLRIDAFVHVTYFNRFHSSINTHRKEFNAIFGLQSSQDESDIFEDNFGVQSVSTVKGLKKVSHGDFPDTTMKKITSTNEADIDSLTINADTKTVFHTTISQGRIIYTPTKPVTYGAWNGLFYILVDFDGGDGSYVIGEGLNGGYSVCGTPRDTNNLCSWTQNFFDLLVQTNYASGITSTVSVFPPVIILGQGITVVINYFQGALHWVKNFFYTPTTTGTQVIRAQIGGGVSEPVGVGDTPKIGKINTRWDSFIIESADRYGIPRGILKAVFHKETMSNLFDPKTSRYEPKRDFQNFSGYYQLGNINYPTNSLNSLPFSQFTLPGKNSRGATIQKGSRVDSLPRDYRSTLKNVQNGGWQLRGIITDDRPPLDDILTVAELYANDYDRDNGAHSQGWQSFDSSIGFTGSFTPQFLLSSSYGLGHVMYLESTEAKDPQGNLIMNNSNNPHDIVDNVGLGIELAAAVLKGKFRSLVQNDNCGGWSDTLLRYNGNDDYITGVDSVCDLYNSNYK